MSSKETIVDVGKPAKLSLTTRGGRPKFVICGERGDVEAALEKMGVDHINLAPDAVYTEGHSWIDLAWPRKIPSGVDPERAHQVVYSFSDN